jgi:hypothetical protein
LRGSEARERGVIEGTAGEGAETGGGVTLSFSFSLSIDTFSSLLRFRISDGEGLPLSFPSTTPSLFTSAATQLFVHERCAETGLGSFSKIAESDGERERIERGEEREIGEGEGVFISALRSEEVLEERVVPHDRVTWRCERGSENVRLFILRDRMTPATFAGTEGRECVGADEEDE